MRKIDYPEIGETLYVSTLPNGLRINVIVKPGFTRSTAFFASDYGGADRRFRLGGEWTDTPAGVAHFLEHKLFDMPDGENALSSMSANGASPNAFTTSDMTAFYFESTHGFYDNLRALLTFVSTPWFTPESVAKEQGIIAQEIRMYDDDPDSVIYDEMLRSLYQSNPIRDNVAGTVESIAQITDKTLYDCHRVFYSPCNMTLCVVGDVDPEAVEAAAREVLPNSGGERPERDYGPDEGLLPYRTRCSREMEVSAPQFLIGAKLRSAKDGSELLRQKLIGASALSCVFGSSSPFYLRLYAEGLLNTDFSCTLDYAAGTLTATFGGESKDPERVFEEIAAELEKAARGIDAERWERSQKAAYGARIRSLNSFTGLCVSMADASFRGYNLFDAFKTVAEISPEDARAFFADNLTRDRLTMSVICPVGEVTAENDA